MTDDNGGSKKPHTGGRQPLDYNPRIAAYLKSLRGRTRMTQKQVAKACGVSERTLQTWEGVPAAEGRQFSEIYLSHAYKLMRVLGGDLEHFARLYLDEEQDILEDENPTLPTDSDTLATWLRGRMQQATLTPTQVAAASGLDATDVNSILAGKIPSANQLWKLSRGLKADFPGLLALAGAPVDMERTSEHAAWMLQHEEFRPVLQSLLQVPDEALPAIRGVLLTIARQYEKRSPDDESPEEQDRS
jgi:transcriptional regulator with XRE-family HTH domain